MTVADETAGRRRTFAVDEPVRGSVPGAEAFSLPGIDHARDLAHGSIARPPLSRLTGIRVTHVAPGSATATGPVGPWSLLPDGTADYTVLAGTAIEAAVFTGLPAQSDACVTALSVQPLRATSLDSDTFVARARTVHGGRHFMFAEATIEDGAGRVVAFATGSLVSTPCPVVTPEGGSDDDVVYRTPDPWQRPAPASVFPFGIWDEQPGLEVQEQLRRGSLPPVPFFSLMGIQVADAASGQTTHTMPASPWFAMRGMNVATGALASLAHITLSSAALTLSPGGHSLGVLQESISFMGPVPADGRPLVSRARAVHVEDLLVLECEITDADGARVAFGHQTVKLLARKTSVQRAPERQLLTVMFTDIVDSTSRADALGDMAWGELLDAHQAHVRRQLEVFRGREVKTTGDGFLATFDSPGRAVHCARAIRDGARSVGLEVRAGIHTGECEVANGDVAGIAVHVAARVLAEADAGEVLVSSVVRELSAGSGLLFRDRGVRSLRGVDGDWQLLALDDGV
ncbi:MAG: adenylate/guanylate cyclase domain-containing protein [Acidimicrobiia bacterium]